MGFDTCVCTCYLVSRACFVFWNFVILYVAFTCDPPCLCFTFPWRQQPWYLCASEALHSIKCSLWQELGATLSLMKNVHKLVSYKLRNNMGYGCCSVASWMHKGVVCYGVRFPKTSNLRWWGIEYDSADPLWYFQYVIWLPGENLKGVPSWVMTVSILSV